MATHLKLYLMLVPVFFAIDMLWLGVVAAEAYQHWIGELLSPQVDWLAAMIFYCLFIAGIQYFAIRPGLAAGRLRLAAGQGALFGFFTYMTYDLTNRATLPDWPLAMVLADIAWGMTLCTLVASIGWFIGRRLGLGAQAPQPT
ncbi:DUF2177 family protein [Rhabdochromatium marinum]|uniref:DUF2177 family protein n=1 Tax=Rhabdochromatium marinum TaxID=48729 RepID=UPI001F5BCAC2|nr:DUF2177 family protein [Rhabdochromatium marinum]